VKGLEGDGRRGAGEKGGNGEQSEKLRKIKFEIFAYRVNNFLSLLLVFITWT
jgi:hypothetical protein